MLDRLAKDLQEVSQVEQSPKMDTRTMTMLLAPKQAQT
jgi:translation initiation factor IF-3